MPGPTPPSLERLARGGPAGADEEAIARLLPELLEEYRSRLPRTLGPVKAVVDGRPFPTLLEAFADPTVAFHRFELELPEAVVGGPSWEYLRPIHRLEIDVDGGSEAIPPTSSSGGPRRVMARVLLREHFPPGGGGTLPKPEGDGVPTLAALARNVRAYGIAPFQVALLLYFSEERFRYEVDLVGNQLLQDRRAGRLPASRRVHRTARLSHGVDAFVAKGELALSNARALELLVDTHGVTDVEMAHFLGGVREIGRSALEGLRSRHLATFDARLGVYRPRLDAFLTATERRRPEAAAYAPLPDPSLRTSVSELLAAADARATCPLCGDVLPAGPRGILCARCQAEVSQPT